MGLFNIKIVLIVITAFLAITILLDLNPRKHASNKKAIPAQTTMGSEALSTLKPPTPRDAKIGKASMLCDDGLVELYERALKLQEIHNDMFGYPMSVLQEPMSLESLSKPAYLLQLVLAELAKPESVRLQWLFWVDADIVLMNPNIPLEAFLPPEPAYLEVHCVTTKDQKGLSNGAFFIRVHEWSVRFLSAVISLTTYEPATQLKYGDQSAMQVVLENAHFAEHTIYVPQRWFNAYTGHRGKDNHDLLSKARKAAVNVVQEGDLQVRVVGGKTRKSQLMLSFLEVSEMHTDRWAVPYGRTAYRQETANFWAVEAPRQMGGIVETLATTNEQAAEDVNRRVDEALARAESQVVRFFI